MTDPTDSTAWMLDNEISQFLIMNTFYIKFMCLVGYTFYAGNKVFPYAPPTASTSYKFVYHVMASTGGGILVPIFLNGTPVPLAYDYYIFAILISFAIHHYAPVLREVMKMSPIFKTLIVIFYETIRAGVVCTMTALGGQKNTPEYALLPPLWSNNMRHNWWVWCRIFPSQQGFGPD